MSMDRIITEEARLIILRELFAQRNRSSTSSALRDFLEEDFLIVKSRPWVEEQLEYLKEMDAVRITSAGSVKIATLAPRGLQHLSHRLPIPDVKLSTEPVL